MGTNVTFTKQISMNRFRYYLSNTRILGIKSPSFWTMDENTAKPVLYFRKAKGATDEEFEIALRILGYKDKDLEVTGE